MVARVEPQLVAEKGRRAASAAVNVSASAAATPLDSQHWQIMPLSFLVYAAM